jgi:hypothetical protein
VTFITSAHALAYQLYIQQSNDWQPGDPFFSYSSISGVILSLFSAWKATLESALAPPTPADNTAPVSSIDSGPDDPTNSTGATFTFSGTDNHSAAGDLTFECRLDAGGYASCTSPHALAGLAEGSHTLDVRATDEAGNTEATASHTWTVDLTAPVITASRDVAPNDDGWNNASVTVSYSCTDSLTGVASCSGPVTLGEGGGQSVTGTAVDLAGNSASVTESSINIDLTPPTVTPPADQTVVATSAAGAEASFSVAATDNLSGVKSLVSNPASGSTFPLGTTATSHTPRTWQAMSRPPPTR